MSRSAAARSFLPQPMDEAAIRRHHEDGQRRVLAEIHPVDPDTDVDVRTATDDGGAFYYGADQNGDPITMTTGGTDPEPLMRPSARPKNVAENTSYRDVIAALRQVDVCDSCGKTRVLLNNAGHRAGYHEERPNPAIHCACVGGPAYAGIGGTR